MRARTLAVGALALLLLVFTSGCGRRMYRVKGVVTLDGQPVKGATIVFYPDTGRGIQAHDLTREDGSYDVATYKPSDGLMPGRYKVMITLPDKHVPKMDDVHPGMSMAEVMGLYAQRLKELQSKPQEPLPQLPKIFGDHDLTPLKVTVPGDGGPINFDMHDDK